MALITHIPKNFKTLNPVDGCDMGCPYCYAERMNARFKWIKDWKHPEFFPERVKFNTKKPQIFFIDSMSDFAAWEPAWQDYVIAHICANPQNRYMTLTKRPQLYCGTLPSTWWYGVTVTCAADKSRIQIMRENITGAHLHISFEPLHGDVGELDFDRIEWISMGPESGNRSGKIIPKKEWFMNIVDQAKAHNIPIMMKDSVIKFVGQENFYCEYPFGIEQW